MAVTVYTKNEMDVLSGEQTTFGTALADSQIFNGLTTVIAGPGVFGSILDVEIPVLDLNFNERLPNRSNSGKRVLSRENIQHDYEGSTPKIMLKGDCKKKELAADLFSGIQSCISEAAGTPFQKQFKFPLTQPDFTTAHGSPRTAADGHFSTIILKQPIASTSMKIKDAICQKWTLTCKPEDNQGRLYGSWEKIGRGAPTLSSNPSGLATRASQDFYYFHDIAVFTGNGQTLNPTGIEITGELKGLSCVSVQQGALSQGLTWAIPEYSITAKFSVLYDAAAQAIQAVVGTTLDYSWVLKWGSTGVDGYLAFTIQAQMSSAPDVNADLKTIDFNLIGIASGATAPLVVDIADGIDRAWS